MNNPLIKTGQGDYERRYTPEVSDGSPIAGLVAAVGIIALVGLCVLAVMASGGAT